MRLPRMTTRRWMLAVAVVALLIAASLEAARLTRRAGEYRQYAVWHAAMRDLCLGEADGYRDACAHRATGDRREEAELLLREAHERTLAEHHDALVIKYERTARFPCLPIEPDPPEPQ
jgi:hypothetical protein